MTTIARRLMADFRQKILDAWSLQPLLVPLYAILLSFIVGGVLIAIIGVNPFAAYWALLRGMVGSPRQDRGVVGPVGSVHRLGPGAGLRLPGRLVQHRRRGSALGGGIVAAWVGTLAFMTDTPGIVAVPIILLAGRPAASCGAAFPACCEPRPGPTR